MDRVHFFDPSRFGVNFVANSVITSKAMLQKHPQTVEELDKGTDDILRKKQFAATRKLVQLAASVQIGTIDIEAWKQTEAIMLAEKQIKQAVHVERYFKKIN